MWVWQKIKRGKKSVEGGTFIKNMVNQLREQRDTFFSIKDRFIERMTNR